MGVSVLFVCLGNICRSPLAEAAFRAVAKQHGLSVDTDSAGTGDWHAGHPPDPRAQAVALSKGVNISAYRARCVIPEDFERFSHIFAMDSRNLADLKRIRPSNAAAHVSLLLDLVPGMEGQNVRDPYYGDADGFEETWSAVHAAAERLVRQLTQTR